MTVGEQATAAGRAIERDSFRLIDEEAGLHTYPAEQWPLVRRLIHASADFEFNGLVRFHPAVIEAGLAAVRRGGTPIVVDVEMIRAGLSVPRLAHFGMSVRSFISDSDVIERAQAEDGTRATQAMRKAHRQGVLDGALVGIGNAPTALLEVVRLIREEDARPALVIGMLVGFVAAAESKERLMEIEAVPWMAIRGRKGGSPLVVAAIHALFAQAA